MNFQLRSILHLFVILTNFNVTKNNDYNMYIRYFLYGVRIFYKELCFKFLRFLTYINRKNSKISKFY